MFSRLHELVDGLSDGDFTTYRNSSLTRKHLQSVKKECDKLRKQILDICKEANPGIFKTK